MSARFSLLILFILSVLFLIHRQRFIHLSRKYYPGQAPTNINTQTYKKDKNNYYQTGKYNISHAPIPKWNLQNPLGFIDLLSRKKVNGYMFTQYNLYKTQINFVDLGYSSFVQINFWTEDIGTLKIQEKIGFSLNQDFNTTNLNLDIKKKHFEMSVRQNQRIGRNNQTQTVTTFNITLTQKTAQFNGNYTHIKRDQECFTAVRNGIISHKCYGGYGYGKIKMTQITYEQENNQNKKKMSAYNPKSNLTRCSFDGFRGSGWDWKWTWIYGTGFSKPQFYSKNQTIQKQRWIGFNFGSLYNKSQDFLFLNGRIYPMSGVKYVLDQKFPLKKNITFTVQNPKIDMKFEVMNRNEYFQDMGILKNDMIKAQGHWVGYVMDPENKTNKIEFYQMSGIIETVNSIF